MNDYNEMILIIRNKRVAGCNNSILIQSVCQCVIDVWSCRNKTKEILLNTLRLTLIEIKKVEVGKLDFK